MHAETDDPIGLGRAVDAMLDGAAGVTILTLGDIMLDRFVSGAVERISPEAPIPVLAVERETVMPGGAGNVVNNIRALGGKTGVIAVVGVDREADCLTSLLSLAKDVGFVRDPGRPTAVKTRFIAGGQQLLRADFEHSRPVSAEIEEQLVRELALRLPQADALVLSDYGKGVLTHKVLNAAIEAAAASGVPVIVDPKGPDYTRYRGASLVTPNLKELREAAGDLGQGDEQVEAGARAVLARSGIAAMIVTRGPEGLSVVRPDSPPVHVRAQAREVFDVSGAGDTVVATLALALATGAELPMAARLANLAASIVVGKVGTAPVTAEELRAAADDGAHFHSKLKTTAALVDQVERWRRRNLRVGFTNGCFDLLHPGHVSLIRQARAGCDRLIVGLNSDASVRRLKGPTRPVSTETARADVLSAIADVDAVVIFDEETPIRLIEALRPDVLVKGADYAINQIVGADFVTSYGGKVMRATLQPGHSTSTLIARMVAP